MSGLWRNGAVPSDHDKRTTFQVVGIVLLQVRRGTVQWANDTYALYGEVSVNASPADTSDNGAYKGAVGFRAK